VPQTSHTHTLTHSQSNMPLLTVYLAASTEAEAQAVRDDFLTHIESLDTTAPDAVCVDITVMRDKDIKALCSGKDLTLDPTALVHTLETFIASKKPKLPKKDKKKKTSLDLTTPLKVIVLATFPETVEQFKAIIETSSPFPVLDSVVRVVMKAPGEALAK
jgi:hypothetical protein